MVSPLSRHIPALDGLRAIAVIPVLFLHSMYGIPCGGFLGVDLFFVLSGYLITGLLLKEYGESQKIRIDLFYLRRMCRLLPAILVAVLLPVVLHPWYPPDMLAWWNNHYNWLTFAAVFFFFANFVADKMLPFGVMWSLAVEEQYYLVWPFVLFLSLRRSQKRETLLKVLITALCLGVVLRAAMTTAGWDRGYLYVFTPTRLDSILLGSLAAALADKPFIIQTVRTLARYRLPEITVGIYVVLCFITHQKDAPLYYGGFTIIGLLFASLILCLVYEERTTWLLWFLNFAPVRWIGRRSYGIYIYTPHLTFLFESLRVPHSPLNFFGIITLRIAVIICFSALSYRFIELPFLRRKQKLKHKSDPPDDLEPASARAGMA